MFISIIFVFVTLLLFIEWRKRKQPFYELAQKLPGPPTVPIFGNGLSISKYPKGIMHYMINSSKEYGTVTRHWVGSRLLVYLTDPNDIEIILKDTRNIRKSTTYDYMKPWLGDGLVTSTGAHWHHHRKSLTPAFHFNILEKFIEVFTEKGKVLISKLGKHADDGEAFDIFPYITLYTLDAIMETSMGQAVNIQNETESNYVTSLNRLQEILFTRMFNPMLQKDIIFKYTKLGKEQNELLDYIHGYCKKVIEDRRNNLDVLVNGLNTVDDIGNKKRLAFLDLLLVGQEMGSGLTNADLLDEVNTFLFAGHDTTSAAIAFAISNLAKHQEMQQAVYEEIVELFGKDDCALTMQELQKTRYLDMFVKETLRMYPPIPQISRLLETDLQLTKYNIPAGTALTAFIFMLHRNEDHYENPDVFDPERFSPENIKDRCPYAFLPFSAGPRNCIGQKYAMAEIKITLIDILKYFKILYAEDIKEIQNYIVLTPIGGVKVRLENRLIA